MRILLLRHGLPDYTTDTLTARGRSEAALLADRLSHYRIRDFYVSPLGRARETAGFTLQRMGRQAETLDWLQEFRGRYFDPIAGRERIVWDMLPREWVRYPELMDVRAWPECPLFENTNVPSVWRETTDGIDALMARYGFRKDGPVWLCDQNTPDTIALFCHFGISMAVLSWLTDLSPFLFWQKTLCLPSALTEITTEERIQGEVSFRITKLGDLTHLESAGVPRSTAGQYPECFTGVDSTDPGINRTPEIPY